MIVVLTTSAGRHTIDEYLAVAGASLRDALTVWTYPELFRRLARGLAPAGTYVFADVERLDDATRAEALAAWTTLQSDAARWRTLNHPARTLRRLALLEALHAAGINDFRAWRADRPAPPEVRFPVFLRIADDHLGARSDLLADGGALAAAQSDLVASGEDLARWIVCEYANCVRPDGTFVKFGAFVLDGLIVPRHMLVGRSWVVKYGELTSPAILHAAWCYILTNPHAEALADVARLAGVAYGRIDYDAGPDGRLRVWEINTNPQIVSLAVAADHVRRSFSRAWHARFERLLRELDARVVSTRLHPGWLERARWRARVADHPGLGLGLERRLWSLARALWSRGSRLG